MLFMKVEIFSTQKSSMPLLLSDFECGLYFILVLIYSEKSEISDRLDSYSRQVFIYLDPILIYISL